MADDFHTTSGPQSLQQLVADLVDEALATAARRGRALTSLTLKGDRPLLIENLARAVLIARDRADVVLQVGLSADIARLAALQTGPLSRSGTL